MLQTTRIKLNLLFKLSNVNSNFELALGYLNPALDNSALLLNLQASFLVTNFLCCSLFRSS